MVNKDTANSPSVPSCPQGCPLCPLGEPGEGLAGWTAAHEAAARTGELRRGRLIATAAGVFVVPLLAAAAAALAVGGGETRRFAGLGVGLAAALVLNALIGWWARRRRTNKEPA